MIKNWTERKAKYLLIFKKLQDQTGSVRASILAQEIGKTEAATYNFLNYMQDNELIDKPVDGVFKLTEKGELLYEEEMTDEQ